MKLFKSIFIFIKIGYSINMWDVYFESMPAMGYDKYMVLNPKVN